MLRAWPGILAVFALLAATTGVLVAGTQSASAASRSAAGHSVGGRDLSGHPPTQVRVTNTERSDAVKHRALPGTPVSVAGESVELPAPGEPSELRTEPATAPLPYHATPALGRAPPR